MLLSLPYWLFEMLRHGKYCRGLSERLGRIPARIVPAVTFAKTTADGMPRVIWIHAVSVGEVIAVSGLVAAMRSRFSDYRVFVSTTTDTGQDMARKRFGEENVFYFPMDFNFCDTTLPASS